MAKYFGRVGYAITEETSPDVYTEKIVARSYYGDLLKNNRRLQTTAERLNDDITVSNEISILADPFAYEHFYAIRYAELNGVKWKVTNVDVQFPRLVLSLGGVYNAD